MTSPNFLNYGYKLKREYTTGTLRNFEPIKNFYILQPNKALERPLIVPLESLELFEQYHTYHLEGSVTNQAFLNTIQFHNGRKITDFEKEIRKAIKASITEVDTIHNKRINCNTQFTIRTSNKLGNISFLMI